MEINNFLLNYIKQDIPKEILRENFIFEGKILEMLDGAILIDVPEKGIIRAESDVDLSKYLGEDIKFLIESKTDTRVEIKPIVEETSGNINVEKETSLVKTLKKFGIEDNELSKSLLENLMKNELPLKEEFVNNSLKTLDKLIQLIEINEDESLELVVKNQKIEESNIDDKYMENVKNEDFYNKNIEEEVIETPILDETRPDSLDSDIKEKNLKIFREIMEKFPEMDREIKADIKNIILTSNKSEKNDKVTNLVKEFLSNFKGDSSSEELIDIVTYMAKNDIKPSLNNIKNMKELLDNPFEFMEEINELGRNLEDETFIKNKILKELDLPLALEKEILEEGKIKNKNSREIMEIIEEKLVIKPETRDNILEIKNKIEFIKDMNNEIYYHMIPLTYGEDELEGFINIMKDKKSKSIDDGKINIFINLETNYLGNVKISCQADGEYLSLRIGLNLEDQFLFELGKETLISRIENYGYIVKNLSFMEENKINIFDNTLGDKDPMHFLDIKV